MRPPFPRLTIAGLMALVLFLGAGFAALRNADEFWASSTFTLAIIALSAAIVGAIVSKGPGRSAWVGFAVFGTAYILVALLPSRQAGSLGAGPIYWPTLMVEWGTARLQPSLHPIAPGSNDWQFYDQVSHSLAIIVFGLVGAAIGRLIAAKDDRP